MSWIITDDGKISSTGQPPLKPEVKKEIGSIIKRQFAACPMYSTQFYWCDSCQAVQVPAFGALCQNCVEKRERINKMNAERQDLRVLFWIIAFVGVGFVFAYQLIEM